MDYALALASFRVGRACRCSDYALAVADLSGRGRVCAKAMREIVGLSRGRVYLCKDNALARADIRGGGGPV
jgi:hypothetical protein